MSSPAISYTCHCGAEYTTAFHWRHGMTWTTDEGEWTYDNCRKCDDELPSIAGVQAIRDLIQRWKQDAPDENLATYAARPYTREENDA